MAQTTCRPLGPKKTTHASRAALWRRWHGADEEGRYSPCRYDVTLGGSTKPPRLRGATSANRTRLRAARLSDRAYVEGRQRLVVRSDGALGMSGDTAPERLREAQESGYHGFYASAPQWRGN